MAVIAAIALLAPGMGPARAAVSDEGQAWLGVYSQTLTPELRDGLGYKGDGALVSRVVSGSAAERAGIKKGDVIVGINTTTIATASGLSRAIRGAAVGQTVTLRVVRDGARRSMSAKLEARPEVSEQESMDEDAPDAPEPPEAPEVPEAPEPPTWGDRRFKFDLGPGFDLGDIGSGMTMLHMGRGRLGVRVESLNPDLGGYFGVKDGKGALILEVLKETPAERAGLKAGDVITRVGDKPVADAEDLVKALGDAEKKASLTVVRKGATRVVESELGEAPRVMRWHGQGPLGMKDGKDGDVRVRVLRDGEDGANVRREIESLRRELRELRSRIEGLNRN